LPTLFIVEDNASALRTLRRLVDTTWTVHCASNLDDALRLLGTARDWSGFLLDIGLGDEPYGGIRVLRAVRRWWPLVPAALVTGTLEPPVINEAAALGATMLAKPPGPQDLKLFLRDAHACSVVGERAVRVADDASSRYGLTPAERQLVWWLACGNSAATYRATLGTSGGSTQIGSMAVEDFVARILAKACVATTEALLIQLRCQTALGRVA
jgi:CheY-like chemotaxis protein